MAPQVWCVLLGFFEGCSPSHGMQGDGCMGQPEQCCNRPSPDLYALYITPHVGPEKQHSAATVIQKFWRRQLGMKAALARRAEIEQEAAQRALAVQHAAATAIQVSA